MTSEINLSHELRRAIAKTCSDILGAECGMNIALVGAKGADCVVRAAFLYDCDAVYLAREIAHRGTECCGVQAIASAIADGKYVNITLTDEYLEKTADIIITQYPFPTAIGEGEYESAVAAAYMLSKQSDDFARIITYPHIRHTYISLISCDEKSAHLAAEEILKIKRSCASYDGMGKAGDAAARILAHYRKEIKL